MTPLLEIKDLQASVGDTPILKGINLTINPGEIHAIMGPNGSGKSTMAKQLERQLFNEGFVVQVLDGDNVRSGINNNLGFSEVGEEYLEDGIPHVNMLR